MTTTIPGGQKPIRVRGYAVLTAIKFIDAGLDSHQKARVIEGLTSPVYQRLGTHKALDWYPASDLSCLFGAVARLADHDTEKARDLLHKLGQHVGNEAASTFLRLLMRIMTPRLFAKRIPYLWERDHDGGRVSVDRADVGELTVTFHEVGGYDHIGIVSGGWISVALEAMGKTITGRQCRAWSLETPGPNEVTIEILWR